METIDAHKLELSTRQQNRVWNNMSRLEKVNSLLDYYIETSKTYRLLTESILKGIYECSDIKELFTRHSAQICDIID
jgi:hypothetical protein